MRQTLKKYSKGHFRMNRQEGIDLSGEFSPFLRACVGVGIVLMAAAPFIWALCGGLAKVLTVLRGG